VQAQLDAAGKTAITDAYEGKATVAAYSIVHGRDGAPEWGVAVCDLAEGGRAYAKLLDGDLLASAEEEELVGRTLTLAPTPVESPMSGKATMNVATI
jgi:acetyl-CoA C-acetyltransferase